MQNRRNFLKTAACSVGALAVGSNLGQAAERSPQPASKSHPLREGASMEGFIAPVLETVRVAVIGVGGRGTSAVQRLCQVPGVKVTALCELVEEKAQAQQKWMEESGYGKPELFIGPEAYKRLCDSGICDAIHINTNWMSHFEIALYSLNAGVQTMVEVPGVRTIDQAWELVETSEKRRVNCTLLANCCYGEEEMMMINMARQKVFQELYHAEGCYMHETRTSSMGQAFLSPEKIFSSLDALREHTGATYPHHALGPVSLSLGINRGDQYDYLVSMGSKSYGWHQFALQKFGEDAPVSKISFEDNDFNSTLIHTKCGRTMLIRQVNTAPMPYSRFYSLYGFKGTLHTTPMRVAIEKEIDTGVGQWMGDEEMKVLRTEYGHQLWSLAGKIAQKVGGHGGQDYMMDLRWTYCLRNGLPMDTNVYDLAAWSSIVELSEKSVRNGSRPMEIPDFTRGAWKTNAPIGDWYTDPDKLFRQG